MFGIKKIFKGHKNSEADEVVGKYDLTLEESIKTKNFYRNLTLACVVANIVTVFVASAKPQVLYYMEEMELKKTPTKANACARALYSLKEQRFSSVIFDKSIYSGIAAAFEGFTFSKIESNIEDEKGCLVVVNDGAPRGFRIILQESKNKDNPFFYEVYDIVEEVQKD